MPDIFSKEKRSAIMSRIRSKNTGIEKAAFSFLRREGIYFQKHYSRVVGNPDIAVPSKKMAVFINGDFWHGYRFKKWRNRIPKKYWRKKIESNITRDLRNYSVLKKNGWKVLRLWGHEVIEAPDKTFLKLAKFLRSKNQ
jgi:DNA mismatch endonuclease (patch repair protein)